MENVKINDIELKFEFIPCDLKFNPDYSGDKDWKLLKKRKNYQMQNDFEKIDIFDTPIFAQNVTKLVSEIRSMRLGKDYKRIPFDFLYENGYFETKKFVPTLKRCLEKSEKELSSRQRSAIVNIGARAYFMTVKKQDK